MMFMLLHTYSPNPAAAAVGWKNKVEDFTI
jgi:adenosylmethionine-8-amino-7-oxononanoate aminotransferase